MNKDELEFELARLKHQLKSSIETSKALVHQNDQLREIIELMIDRYSFNDLGDMWTQADKVVLREAKERYEEL